VVAFLRERRSLQGGYRRRPPARALAIVAGLGIVAGVALASAPAAFHSVATAGRPSVQRVRTVPPPLLVSFDTACPSGEVRFDEPEAGYHLCRPAYWVTRSYTHVDGYENAISASGMGAAQLTPATSRITDMAKPPEVLITVSFDTKADLERNLGLTNPTQVTVAGQPADEFVVDDPFEDGPGEVMIVLVERGYRLYRLELRAGGAAGLVEFNQLVRSFTFKGLPYSAEPEFKLDRTTA
jgi:hypothetical protein